MRIYEGFESQVNIINAYEFVCCMKSNCITFLVKHKSLVMKEL